MLAGGSLFAAVDRAALHRLVEIDEVSVEIGTVDAGELHLAARP